MEICGYGTGRRELRAPELLYPRRVGKFGNQLGQLSHVAKTGNATPKAAKTRKDLARTASPITLRGTEPFSQSTGAQYQQTVADLQYLTGDCTVLPS